VKGANVQAFVTMNACVMIYVWIEKSIIENYHSDAVYRTYLLASAAPTTFSSVMTG
jgi:hypothetical protein